MDSLTMLQTSPHWRLTVTLAMLLTSQGSAAAGQPPEPSLFDTLNAPHAYLSQRITSFANGIDRYFGDERFYQESNKTLLRLDFDNSFTPGEYRPELSARAKLVLPATQKRFHLLLETDPERRVTEQQGAAGEPLQVLGTDINTPKDYAAALRFQRQQQDRWHFSTDAGIKLKLHLDPFLRLRGSYTLPMDGWRLRLTQSGYWFNSIGLGETTQLDIEHFIGEQSLFRATSNATWLHDRQAFNLRQDFTILRELDPHNAMLYQLSVLGNSRPSTAITGYVVQLRLRHRLHRQWLFYDVIPQMQYLRDNQFVPEPSLLLRLEVHFGQPVNQPDMAAPS